MRELFPDLGTIRFAKSRDGGGIVNAAVAFARRNAREYIGQYVLLTAPFVIAGGLASQLFVARFQSAVANPGSPEAIRQLEALFGPAFWVTMLVGFLSFAVTQAVAAGYVRLYREGEQGAVTLGLLWNESWPLILPAAGLGLLAMGLFLASVLVASALMQAAGILGLLWIAFWVWLLPYLHVAYASRMLESPNLLAAIGRAAALVREARGAATGALLATWFITVAFVFLISLPPGIVLAIIEVNTVSAPGLGWLDLLAIPFMVLSHVAYALPPLAAFFVHGRLSADLDGADVEDDLDLLEAGLQAAPRTAWEPPASGETAPATDDAPEVEPAPPEAEPSSPPSGGFRGGAWGS